ncbi:MAG: stage II sporulation protein M [Candidatus Nanosalina sp.]
MLPELILKEEEEQRTSLLLVLGLVSGLLGFGFARVLFPSQLGIMAVIFASIPLLYPLTSYFLEREKESKPHIPEVKLYGTIFLGECLGFFLLGLAFPDTFSLQLEIIGAAGYAGNPVSLFSVLSNNILVFAGILVVASIIGSAGAFILTWNASVLGVFLAHIFGQSPVQIIGYVPHASLEMTGFIVAGITGSMVSAAVYREHFDRDTWFDFVKLGFGGVLLIFLAALLETA